MSMSTEANGVVEEETSVEAGPSTIPVASPVEMDEEREGRERSVKGKKLNPKSSSSWLRWNSPAPSFPRSRSTETDPSKDKGKEREDVGSSRPVDDSRDEPRMTGQLVDGSIVDNRALEEPTALDSDKISISNTGSQAGSVPPPSTVKGRWWSRSNPPVTSTNGQSKGSALELGSQTPVQGTEPRPVSVPSPAASPKEETTMPNHQESEMTVPQIKSQETSSTVVEPPRVKVNTSKPDASQPPADSSVPIVPVQSPKEPALASEDVDKQANAPVKKGWGDYLGWSSGKTADAIPASAAGSNNTRAEDSQPDVEQNNTALSVEELARSTSETEIPTLPQPKAGWGSYFYSFVANPPPAAQPSSTSTTVVEPTDAATDQKPVSAPRTPPSLAVQAASPLPTTSGPLVPPTSTNASLAASPSIDNPLNTRKSSVASQTGWLNYLAIKASQKKITNASTASIKSGKERKSLEMAAEEEVMDFSSDPNFPLAGSGEETIKQNKGTLVKKEPTLTKKASQNLVVRDRRASIESTRSTQNTQLASSPKSKVVPKSSGSALPQQPVPAQPNFIIPTFEDTFDRPPRSLLPHVEGSQGATGLAWRAVGAVGSYVYGGKTQQPEPPSGQGMREGRRVGSDLPRRIGLDGGGGDEGWKHVKRVVVVGVHGWFPAKMLNSWVTLIIAALN